MDLTEVYLKPPDAKPSVPSCWNARHAEIFAAPRITSNWCDTASAAAPSPSAVSPAISAVFFHLIWECSRRLANVVIENKDFEELIRQYDRKNAVLYCDPPYYMAEGCYPVEFPLEDHQRLHDVLIGVRVLYCFV